MAVVPGLSLESASESGAARGTEERARPAVHAAPREDNFGRLTGVDLVRFGSVVGIVWFHMLAPGREFAYAGLPVLLVLSVAMPVFQSQGRPLRDEAARRAGRLLVPWLFWSAFYGSWSVGRALYRHEPVFQGFDPRWLLIGPELHLWYLPYAYAATLTALALQRGLSGLGGRLICLIGALLGATLLLASPLIQRTCLLRPPYCEWLFSLATIPFGLALGVALQRLRPASLRLTLALVGTAAAASALTLYAIGERDTAIAYGIGIPLACLTVLWTPRLNALGHVLVTLPMGIYLLHSFVYQRLHHFGLAFVGSGTSAFSVIVISALLTIVLQRTPLRRFV